jgi:hypothetical protein
MCDVEDELNKDSIEVEESREENIEPIVKLSDDLSDRDRFIAAR